MPDEMFSKVEKKLYRITIQEGQTSSLNYAYYSNNEPYVSAELVDLDNDVHVVFMWVSFIPNNGYEPGKLMHVPYERLISYQEM
jgi:hypothetical protein